MNILCLFPVYSYLDLAEATVLKGFLSTADKILETSALGRNRLFLIAENDTARKLKQDVPKAKYIKLSLDADLDLVEISSMKDCYYVGDVEPQMDLSSQTDGKDVTNIAEFEKYYPEYLKARLEYAMQQFNVVVNFTLGKYSRFRVKNIPDSIIYCEYDIVSGSFKVYIGGYYNEAMSTEWKGKGLPYEA